MDETSIIEIDGDGLLYQDEVGNRVYIDFAACHEQYLKMWREPERIERVRQLNNMDDDRLAQFLAKIRQLREIGIRQPLQPPWAEGPYLEFYTDPPTRFRFTSYEAYSEILSVIEKARWKTYDQS